MNLTPYRALVPAVALIAATMLTPAAGQQPMPSQQNPVCVRLEAQLQAFDRSTNDPARAEQVRRYEEAARNQQAEIGRQEAAAQRAGCNNNNFFVLFSGQPAQCGPLNAKIQQMRANLDGLHAELERMRGASAPEREGQRHAILVALSQNNCGPQYRSAAATPPSSGNFFERLFGPGPNTITTPDNNPNYAAPAGTYRTLCVRTCDGYYYPISFATSPDHFADDEKACQRSCPASEVMLFSHRNPGEDVSQAVSTSGQPYSSLPNAFRYRQTVDNTCSCRNPGESWAQALKNLDDNTVEQGDIVVNEQRARALSQPRVDAQGKPIRPDPRAARTASQPAAQTAPAQTTPAQPSPSTTSSTQPDAVPHKPDPNRTVRDVGPPFLLSR
jgi:hypothetical protein